MHLVITVAGLPALERELGARFATLLRLTFYDLAENAVVGGLYSKGTPVDTGFARASWWLGVNQPGDPVQPAQPPVGSRHVKWLPSLDPLQLAAVRAGDILYLSTNCAYIRPLEYGHSAQAPQGMLRLAVAAAQQMADENARTLRARRA